MNIMNRKQIWKIGLVVLGCFALVFPVIGSDDLGEADAASTQLEMLKELSQTTPSPTDQQAVSSKLLAASSTSARGTSSGIKTPAPALASLASCVFLC